MTKLLLLFLLTFRIPIHAQNDLPCFDSSEICVERLTAQAITNSEEIKVIDATIKLARRKGWTQYIDVSAIDPLTLSVQILRNIFGGGERQTRKLAISQLELRRTETVKNLRAEISSFLLQAETINQKRMQSQLLFDAQRILVAVLEVSYKSGELSTERMLPVWEKLDFYKIEIQNAETGRETIKKKLVALVESQPLRELTREDARTRVVEDVENVWKLSGTTEKLNLIVLDADERKRVFKSELLQVFPEGVKHLPDKLAPREIYRTTRNGTRKVQYIGKAERFGFNFILFRSIK